MAIGELFSNGKKKTKITPFKALMSILAGTLGIGNITGVASAIILGGIGSIFWIFVSGFIAVAISYAESCGFKEFKRGIYSSFQIKVL